MSKGKNSLFTIYHPIFQDKEYSAVSKLIFTTLGQSSLVSNKPLWQELVESNKKWQNKYYSIPNFYVHAITEKLMINFLIFLGSNNCRFSDVIKCFEDHGYVEQSNTIGQCLAEIQEKYPLKISDLNNSSILTSDDIGIINTALFSNSSLDSSKKVWHCLDVECQYGILTSFNYHNCERWLDDAAGKAKNVFFKWLARCYPRYTLQEFIDDLRKHDQPQAAETIEKYL